jgi:hypothetical protein
MSPEPDSTKITPVELLPALSKRIKWGKVWTAIAGTVAMAVPYVMQGNPDGITVQGHLIPWWALLLGLSALGIHATRDPIPDASLGKVPLVGKLLQTGDGTGPISFTIRPFMGDGGEGSDIGEHCFTSGLPV